MGSSFHIEQPPASLSRLTPGKIVLPKVPLFKGAVEISTPKKRPLISLDVAVEIDLIEVRRTDREEFNVRHYRSEKGQSGPAEPHKMLVEPVLAIILSRDAANNWWLDGHELEIDDPIGASCFIEKIAEVAEQEQR